MMEWNVKKDLADYLFEDCDRIAQTYEDKLVNVVIQFTKIESAERLAKRDIKYITIINMTEEYFKQAYRKVHK